MKLLHILIICNSTLPVSKYGGTQRVVWALGKELAGMGHRITFLAGEGSVSDFADVKVLDVNQPLAGQIPQNVDLVHSLSVVGKISLNLLSIPRRGIQPQTGISRSTLALFPGTMLPDMGAKGLCSLEVEEFAGLYQLGAGGRNAITRAGWHQGQPEDGREDYLGYECPL